MQEYKKDYLKTNYNKIIVFCLILFFGIGLLFSSNILKEEVKAFYPSSPDEVILTLNGDMLTPSGPAVSNPGHITWYYYRVPYFVTNNDFSNEAIVRYQERIKKFEENEIKAINLNDFTWEANTVYTLWLFGNIWDDNSVFISNLIYYVPGRTVSNEPINTPGYSYKLSDKPKGSNDDLTIDGNIVTITGNSIAGDLKISYFSGVDNTFGTLAVGHVDDVDVNVSIDLSYLPLAQYTAYKVYFEGLDYYSNPVVMPEWIYSISPMLPLPTAPQKEGYTFVGWYYDEEYTQPYIDGTPIFEDTTLYAKYEINTYTVTYILNGDTYRIDAVTYNSYAQNFEISQTGYTFSGWHTDAECENPYDFNIPVKSHLTLYGRNIINKYTVTFDANGGIVKSGNAVQIVEYGKPAVAPIVEREGYTFKGWDKVFNNITNDLTVIALWEINKYKVTFDANGGIIKSGDAVQTVEYGNSAIAPVVERIGYNFKGWDKSFSSITGDLTVTAQWEIITFKVTFIVDGVEYDTITIEYGTMFYENKSVQEILGTLSAVYSDAQKTSLFMPTSAINEDITLFAEVDASLRGWLDFALWFQKYWMWLAIGAGVLALVITVVVIKVKGGK
ncbi:MAG TPA: InlB B-repeat-containing protein [Clostridiales bacterium]|nr:InlB B-repeat-containing protein [Clostridiales bacterium]